ncbi:hypothetical protein [Streptomyces sp. NPDC002908]|uniref:hypothetical protein n=1 Tax=Streptomyces sp. NPDC002908 TaxID=3364670 RepID=UPI0036C0A1B7
MVNEETNETVTREVQKLSANDSRRLVAERCQEKGIKFEWSLSGDGELLLRVGIPNGRDQRPRLLSAEGAREYIAAEFQNVKALGEFEAYLFTDDGVIEAVVRNLGDAIASRRPAMIDLPGVEVISSQPSLFDANVDESPVGIDGITGLRPGDDWVIRVDNPDGAPVEIELGTVTERFRTFAGARYRRRIGMRDGKYPTLRIKGLSVTRHEAALSLLKRVSDAFFFEVDLIHGVTLKIAPAAPRGRLSGRVRARGSETPASLSRPRSQYAEKPLSLYWYARSTSNMPLLEYLAYYQVLEYYFPSYSRRDALDRLRHELRDPRFRPDDDDDLSRILSLVANSGKGFGTEREQLKATIKGCTTSSHVKDLVAGDAWMVEHFDSRSIQGVAMIDVKNSKSDLLDQVANRVYDIRCRIVHTKEDAGKSAEILLPFSKEADALAPDVELVRFLAQKCLIAGGKRMQL